MTQPKILAIDGMNFLHRCRSGFALGDVPVVFNAFRNLRALVEMHSPTRVYFVLEGHPKARHAVLPEYKANRYVDANDPVNEKKIAETKNFFRQVDLIVDLLSKHFPVSVVRHADFEADDTIYNLIKRSTSAVDWIVASNDSDFTQLLGEFPNVRLNNPMLKTFVEEPEYDYVVWKSLRGDGSDNIPGLPGIGDVTATKLVNDPEALTKLFSDPALAELFKKNHFLIKFHTWTDEETMAMTSSSPKKDWYAVSSAFAGWKFQSLIKEPYFRNYKTTFNPLFGE
jgi:5'-3' exonuclease